MLFGKNLKLPEILCTICKSRCPAPSLKLFIIIFLFQTTWLLIINARSAKLTSPMRILSLFLSFCPPAGTHCVEGACRVQTSAQWNIVILLYLVRTEMEPLSTTPCWGRSSLRTTPVQLCLLEVLR